MTPTLKGLALISVTCSLMLLEQPNASGATLVDELTSRSIAEGLGIAHYSDSGELQVFYFDNRRTSRILRVPGMYGTYDIEPHHQIILASIKGILEALGEERRSLTTGTFALLSLDGHVVKNMGLMIWPRLAVISPNLDSIAVLLVDQVTRRATLRYGKVDWLVSQQIYVSDLGNDSEDVHLERYREENFSWSPDQKSIAYSLNQRLYIFDTFTAQTHYVVEGSDPCWSPDGTSIVFRSPAHALAQYRLRDRQIQTLTKNMEVVGFPRWSPDAKYVLFTQFSPKLASRDILTMPSTEFRVIRVEDGATIPVYTPPMGMDNRRFYWIKTGSLDALRPQ